MSREAGRIRVESGDVGRRYSEDFINNLCGQREDREGWAEGNGKLRVTEWSGTCQGIRFGRETVGMGEQEGEGYEER